MPIFVKTPIRLLCALFMISVSFVHSSHSLVLGPSESEVERQKYENLFKKREEVGEIKRKASETSGAKSLNLQFTKEMYTEVRKEEISQERLAEATSYLEKRLQEDLSIPLNYDHLPKREREVATAVRNLSVFGMAMFSVLFAMPTEYTNWPDDKSFSELLHDYEDNVKAGPVIDGDSAVFNYFIHPMSGAYLYQILRNKGFTKMESFGFAVFASTVLWEYGIEAIAEVPSLQDLLITPIVGSLLGEVFHQWDLKIKEKDYRVAGSRKLGKLIHYILNPVEGINNSMDRLFRVKFLRLQNAHFYFRDQNQKFREAQGGYLKEEWTFGLRFLFTF